MPIDVTLRAETRGALTIYPVESARAFGVDAFVTDRFGGVSKDPYDSLNLAFHVGDDASDVEENRRRVAKAIDVALSKLTTVSQAHGCDVLDAASATSSSEADALVYDVDDLALAVLVADCVPLLLVDASSPRFALVHAGWRGLQRGVIARALAHFEKASNVLAFIGPSISMEGYQVGPEVASHFEDVPGALVSDDGDRSRLDLRCVATSQLLDGGVADGHVVRSTQVTDGGEVFFSDRARRPCGRFALVARRALA
ncbi:MAG: polyphenol oxidase family protein [Acidimicrobiales bacterium]